MSWQILLTISVLTLAISNLLQRVLLKDDKSDPIAFSIVFQGLTGVLIGFYWLSFGGTKVFLPEVKDFSLPVFNIVLMTILYAVGNMLMCRAYKYLEASKMTILFATRSGWTIIGSAIILHQVLSAKQLFGALLIIFSIVLVSWETRKEIFNFGKGEKIALLAAMFFGIAVVNDAAILKKLDASFYMMIAFMMPAIFQTIIFPSKMKLMQKFINKEFLIKLLFLGVFYAISAVTFFMSYQASGNAAQVSALNQTVVIVTVMLAIVFLREKSHLVRKIFGAIVSFIGVILVK